MPDVHDPISEFRALGAEVTEFDAEVEGSEERNGWLDPATLCEPAPLRFTVENLVPEGWITTLYGRGGSAKSYLALIIGYSVVLGQTVLGCAVQQGPVLYVDGELRADEFRRRAYRVCRGFGLDSPPEGVYYRRFHGSLTSQPNAALLTGAIQTHQPQLVIIDSFTALLHGRDSNSIDDVAKRLRHLESLTVSILLIDHVAKAGDPSTASGPIGSVGKYNIMRSGLFVQNTRDGAGVVRPDKSNFGPLHKPIPFEIEFNGSSSVRLVAPLPDVDPRAACADVAGSVEERVMSLFLTKERDEGWSASAIASVVTANEGTVRNALSKLKAQQKVINAHGKWHSRIHESLRKEE